MAPAVASSGKAGAGAPAMEATWISHHLYHDGGIYSRESDEVVRQVVEPLVGYLAMRRWVAGHFFIRYHDGGSHIRLRLRGALIGAGYVGQALAEWVRVRGTGGRPLVTRVVEVPYEPEVVRYGGSVALAAAERFFEASSQMAFAAVRTAREGERVGLEERCWRWGC